MKRKGKKKINPQLVKLRTIIGSKAKGERVKDITITEFSKTILKMCLELKSENVADVDEKYFEIVEFMNKHNIRKSSAWDIVDEVIIQFDLPERDKEKSKRNKPKEEVSKSNDEETKANTEGEGEGTSGESKKSKAEPKQTEKSKSQKMEADIRRLFGEVLVGIQINGPTKLSKLLSKACIELQENKIDDINEKYFEIVKIIKSHKVPARKAWDLVDKMISEFGLPERKTQEQHQGEQSQEEQQQEEQQQEEQSQEEQSQEEQQQEEQQQEEQQQEEQHQEEQNHDEQHRKKSNSIKTYKSKVDLTELEKFIRGENVGEEFLKDISAFGKNEAEIFKNFGKSTSSFYSDWGKKYKLLGVVGATLATGVTGIATIGAAGLEFAYTGAETLTRAFFAVKGTAQKAYKKHQINVMRTNIAQLNDVTPKLVEILEDNAEKYKISEDTYNGLSDEDKQIIDTVRSVNPDSNDKKIGKKYELLKQRGQKQLDDIRLDLLEKAYPDVYRVYEVFASKKFNSGRQKYKLADIYEFLSQAQIDATAENSELIIPDGLKLSAKKLKEDFLGDSDCGISMDDIKTALQVFKEADFLNISEENVVQSLESYGDSQSNELIQNYRNTLQMQMEVSAKYKYQLALEVQAQVDNMEARLNEYIETEEKYVLSSEGEREYKRLRELAKQKIEQLRSQGLVQIENKGERNYMKLCDKSKEMLLEPLGSVEELQNIANQNKKEIRDITGRE